MIRALMIEDEMTARADLRAKLVAHPHIGVVGEAATVAQARVLLARPDYDLVFLDVHLIGGDGFDLTPAVRPEAEIVFVTAYDAYAIRAFEVNALDYLLKPVAPARLAKAIERLRSRAAPIEAPMAEAGPTPPLQMDDRVFLRTAQRAQFSPVAAISAIAAHDNYSEVFLADGSRFFLRKSLKAWEDALPSAHFMRVHRTQIVNLTRVTRYERDASEHTRLTVEGLAEPVEVSRYRWSELRDRLAALHNSP